MFGIHFMSKASFNLHVIFTNTDLTSIRTALGSSLKATHIQGSSRALREAYTYHGCMPAPPGYRGSHSGLENYPSYASLMLLPADLTPHPAFSMTTLYVRFPSEEFSPKMVQLYSNSLRTEYPCSDRKGFPRVCPFSEERKINRTGANRPLPSEVTTSSRYRPVGTAKSSTL